MAHAGGMPAERALGGAARGAPAGRVQVVAVPQLVAPAAEPEAPERQRVQLVSEADPLEPDRVNVYEEWESEDALLAFRGAGPDQDLGASILRADVFRHVVSSTGPA